MLWYEAAAWGVVGVSAYEALVAVGLLNLRKTIGNQQYLPSQLRWPFVLLTDGVHVIVGGITCILVNQAIPTLSIPAALFVGTGGVGFFATLRRLITSTISQRIAHVRKVRESQIQAEAERLAEIRQTEPATPNGVSDEVADILAARREALAGQLPVVHPSNEGRTSR